MKSFEIIVVSCLLFQMACSPTHPADLSHASREAILSTDREMSRMAEQTGFHAALLAFADDSLIKPEEGMLPIFGKKSLEDKWAGEPGTKGLTWEPRKAEASASGDLGYTFGDWKLVRPDTVYFGNYITVWKKHPDGSWKWMLDGGNNTPAPD